MLPSWQHRYRDRQSRRVKLHLPSLGHEDLVHHQHPDLGSLEDHRQRPGKATDRAIYRITASDASTAGSTYDAVHTFGANDVATAIAGHFNANADAGISSAIATGDEVALTQSTGINFKIERGVQDQMTLNLTGSQGDLSTVLASWNGTSFNNNTIVVSSLCAART